MYKKLDQYLEELGHYLDSKEGTGDILSEIKSHILEKTEHEFGEINEENLGKIIETYGHPARVAEKYLEGIQIISPVFKKHLFYYSGLLFLVHFVMTLWAWFSQTTITVFPLFFIPRFDDFQTILYLPMAFIFDVGLVGMILYFITQKNKSIRLPWPVFLKKFETRAVEKKSRNKLIYFILMMVLFGVLLFVFLKFQSLFFVSVDENIESLLDSRASIFSSICLLLLIAAEAVASLIRYLRDSDWVLLIKNAFVLLVFWAVWNYPGEIVFKKDTDFDLMTGGTILLAFLTVIAVVNFIESLIRLMVKRRVKQG
ncbi:MAG: hypothetical protein JW755_11375 [Candidatus Aminicenantes bacterium]|nr:hypothetical protein [Candidatus Aminicenantes bacterium]